MKKHLIAIAAAAVALQGCATPAPSLTASEDLNVGIAKTCTASPIDLTTGAAATATIAMTNDGWCAVRAKEKDGKPFFLGLVGTRPQHGRVFIQKAGSETRLEYTADTRYVGPDRFSVMLRSRTPNTPDVTVQVAVTVSMGEAVATPAPSSPPPRSTTPARAATRPAARPAAR